MRKKKKVEESGRCLPTDIVCKGVYKLGGTSSILHWESLCADAPPHARITVGKTSLTSSQQTQTTSNRHDGWATQRPQNDSLVDIDVTDICLTSSTRITLFFQLLLLDTDCGAESRPTRFGGKKDSIYSDHFIFYHHSNLFFFYIYI